MSDSDAKLNALGRSIREVQDQGLADESVCAEVRQRVLSRPHRQKQDRRWKWAMVPAAAALLVGLGVLGFSMASGLREHPLAFTVSGEPGEGPSARRFVAEGAPLELSFSDGSGVTLQPDAQASVPLVWANGALVQVHRGAVHFEIEHREETRWAVQAGPYTIHVVGTTFDVHWDASHRDFRLDVSEGRVRLEGPDASGVEVAAGHGLRFRPEGPVAESPTSEAGDDLQREVAPEPPSEPEGANALLETTMEPNIEVPPEGAGRRHVAGSRRQGNGPLDPSGVRRWQRLGRDRDFAGALAALEEDGFEQALRRMSPAELYEVAGWARLAGDPRASQVYELLRERHPGTVPAGNAAFLLGRMSEEHNEALGWWLVYAREQPQGRFAEENAGRLLESLVALRRRGEAAIRARQYLERYPDGAHRRLAEAYAR